MLDAISWGLILLHRDPHNGKKIEKYIGKGRQLVANSGGLAADVTIRHYLPLTTISCG